jgi:hypothetical protein
LLESEAVLNSKFEHENIKRKKAPHITGTYKKRNERKAGGC